MKILLILILMPALFSASPVPEHGKWVIDNSSQLLIHGQTNVNTFTCYISCYNNVDTLDYDSKGGELIFKINKMIIPVHNFNCGNNLITKDFRETVNVDKYPYLNIRFLSLHKKNDNDNLCGNMQIELAGVMQEIKVEFEVKHQGNFLQLSGMHHLHFADFRMTPPQKVMGLIKVQEALTVQFDLLIRQLKD